MNKIKDIREAVMSSDLSDNDKYYWGYMYDLGVSTIVPLLIEQGIFKAGDKVAEIGSAEGGVLHALAEAGASEAIGTDIAIERIQTGELITKIAGLDVKYSTHDIIGEEPHAEWHNRYDLVILRDVIEHLDSAYTALANIRKIMKPCGYLYVTFPSYYSPFGGHQHTLAGNALTKLPYIHYFSKGFFEFMIQSGRPQDIEEVMRLRNIRLTPDKFKKAALKAKLNIYREDYYILRPVFKAKFGLPALKMPTFLGIPPFNSVFSTESSFILQK
jgi:2-polyprenyl-3-methyl-5-hydroxy-6-metoxy-1,4-benzoquinol methylase